jgi:hypothetical protein
MANMTNTPKGVCSCSFAEHARTNVRNVRLCSPCSPRAPATIDAGDHLIMQLLADIADIGYDLATPIEIEANARIEESASRIVCPIDRRRQKARLE